MTKLKELISEFKVLDEDVRGRLISGRFQYIEPPKQFEEIAKALFNGYFSIKSNKTGDNNESGDNNEVKVYPTCVEFYYHEEKENGVHDPIVYHRNHGKIKPKILEHGLLHTHVSGIDVTFESDYDGGIRVSALIREFVIVNGKETKVWGLKDKDKDNDLDIEDRPTYLYAALFSQFNIFDGFSIKWEDVKKAEDRNPFYKEDAIICDKRKNVKQYKAVGSGKFEKLADLPDECKWQFRLRKPK